MTEYFMTCDHERGEEYYHYHNTDEDNDTYDDWGLSVKADYHNIEEYDPALLHELDIMLSKMATALLENKYYIDKKSEMTFLLDCFCANGIGWIHLDRYSTIHDKEYEFQYKKLIKD
jgi:hypothetical protein